MRKLEPSNLYWLVNHINSLKKSSNKDAILFEFILKDIKYMVEEIKTLELRTVLKSSDFYFFEDLSKKDSLSSKDLQYLDIYIDSIDKIIQADLNNKYYVELLDGALNLSWLVEDVGKFIYLYEELDSNEKLDFREACRCLVFQRDTACVFHMTRLVDSIVRKLSFNFLGDRFDKQTLGGVLSTIKKSDIKDVRVINIINEIDLIKDVHRNPLAHDNKMYTSYQSLNLCYKVISIVNETLETLHHDSQK